MGLLDTSNRKISKKTKLSPAKVVDKNLIPPSTVCDKYHINLLYLHLIRSLKFPKFELSH